MSRRILHLLFAVLLAAACREPSAREEFVAGGGPFLFQVDMTDTTRTYDFTFYTRLDGRPHLLEKIVDMPLDIQWISPSEEVFQETVWLPLTDPDATYYSRQIRHLYRSGVVPSEPGIWTLNVSVPDTLQIPGLRGLGLIQRYNGTR